MPAPLSSIARDELRAQFQQRNEPAYRADQVLQWLHQKHAANWEAMTNLAKPLREKLAAEYVFSTVELARLQGSGDTTRKFLWRLHDGQLVESVLIPANPALYGEASDRHTLCVSTQVGCAYGCTFCASGLDGFKRNLEPAEIIDQVLAVERWHKEQGGAGERLINNLVIMGMGEPLANYDNLLAALANLNSSWAANIGARKITISTSGLVPEIKKLAAQPRQYRLAISLHGATDEVRERIMPINRKFPLAQLTAAAEEYQREKKGMITLEYILIAGINDNLDQTKPLAQLSRRLHAKVNLIPYNKVDGLDLSRPDERAQDAFCAALEAEGTPVTLRREKGHDIDAACGQLRLRTEKEIASTPATA
jgi:23S rRNA (adenine2503-C2)-methyltransferase